MSTNWSVNVGVGNVWHVASLLSGKAGEVLIPLDQIEGMPDEAIGATVRSLADEAEGAASVVIADFYVANDAANIAPDHPGFARDYAILLRHAGKYTIVDEAIRKIDAAVVLIVARRSRIAAKKPKALPGYIYVLKAGPFYKIGLSKSLDQRMRALAIQLPHAAEMIFSVAVDDVFTHERQLHELFADKRMNGEWFDLTDDDLQTIRAMYSDE